MSDESKSIRRIELPVETAVATVLVLILVWLASAFPDFRTGQNFYAILTSGAEIALIAAGMTMVIATGGIDISVGSVAGLCGIIIGILASAPGSSLGLACAVGLAAGAGCGLINGLLIARFSLPPIIATLATYSAARAGAYVLSQGNSISGLPESLVATVGFGGWLGIPVPAWIAAAGLLAVGITMKKTAFGRSVKALGGNRQAAFLSGLATRRTEILVYVISGLLAAVAAIIVIARQATAIPDAGKYFELRGITAVVVGGTSVAGGRATVIGTTLGVLMVGVVANGVRSYKLGGIWEQLVLGLVLLASVEVDRWRVQRAARAALK